jgi:sulfite reductase alpha subunit-like flavoprotein
MQLAEALQDRFSQHQQQRDEELSPVGTTTPITTPQDPTAQRIPEVDVQPWNHRDSKNETGTMDLDPSDLHVFLCSTTGVGEPPENGREQYEWLLKQPNHDSDERGNHLVATGETATDVCVFGLGNQVAHPSHYNVIGKNTYEKLVNALKCRPIIPLGLGDDGDCIEDDFDRWQQNLLDRLFGPVDDADVSDGVDKVTAASSSSLLEARTSDLPSQPPQQDKQGEATKIANMAREAVGTVRMEPCPGSVSGTRRVSTRYPTLLLESPPGGSSVVRTHLLPMPGNSEENENPSLPGSLLYPQDARLWSVLENRNLNPDPAADGMHELVLELDSRGGGGDDDDHIDPSTSSTKDSRRLYEAGDHMVIYPRNPDCVVQAYLQLLDDVSPHAVIRGIQSPTTSFHSSEAADDATTADKLSFATYPYPLGLTVYETLSHCVDLSAVPTPAAARFLLNRQNIDYRNEIYQPRRTVLTLLQENRGDVEASICLENLLFALAPIQGRYYSISSSPARDPRLVRLLYRPVRYVSGRGYLREGLCSTYMSHLSDKSRVVARINSNPSFRLPADPAVPVVILAAGCGVAPFRAFMEERQVLQEQGETLGECHLFVGFRNPADAVWTDLMEYGLSTGTLTKAHVSYGTGVASPSPLLTSVFRDNSRAVWDLIDARGGYLYICGGAASFGAAVKREVLGMVMEHRVSRGDSRACEADEATAYLQALAHRGRLCEDLAD